MSKNQRLIINCGASCVTAAVISGSGSNLHLDQLATEELEYDQSSDSAAIAATGEALRALVRDHKLSGKATFIVPGHQVLTKTIRIPHVEPAKRAQIIAFEAQQNIPYPLHEVVWDSQVIGDDGVETEVLFIACKTSTIDEFCRIVSAAGLTVESIGATTVLEYNALQALGELDEEVLLINVGARSTNLLFANEDGFFVRNIALGGNSLTQSIADSIGKPFFKANEVKHKFFAGDSEYSEDDSGAQLLRTCSDGFLRRMSQEITRSIVNYRRQKKGSAPKRILLTGRGALLEGLAEHLSESQKVEVSFFDALHGVTLDGAILGDVDALRLQLSEVIGEAVRGSLPDSGAGVNLLPDEVQTAMRFASKKPLILVAAACLALSPWPAVMALKGEADAYNDRARAIKQEVNPLQSRKAQIEDNIGNAKELQDSIARIEGLKNSKVNWIQFFADLQESLVMAEDVWLDDLEVLRSDEVGADPSYEMVLKGQMLVRESASGNGSVDQTVLLNRIRGLQQSFEGSQFVVSSKPPEISWSNLNEGLNVLPFTINLVIDTAKPL